MSAKITSINYCPVKSVSFQSIENCKIKKDIGIIGDRIFAFAKDLDIEQAKLFEKSPEERKGKWNKVLTLKNSPVLNKYNFIFKDEKLTLISKNKEILAIDINQSSEREALSNKISELERRIKEIHENPNSPNVNVNKLDELTEELEANKLEYIEFKKNK